MIPLCACAMASMPENVKLKPCLKCHQSKTLEHFHIITSSPHLQGSTTEPTRQAVCSACNKKASEDSRAARNAKKLALRSIISLNDFLWTLQTAQEDERTTHNLVVALPKETYITLPTKTFTTNPKHTNLSYLMLHAKELVHIISEQSGYQWAWVSYPTMPKGEFHSPY